MIMFKPQIPTEAWQAHTEKLCDVKDMNAVCCITDGRKIIINTNCPSFLFRRTVWRATAASRRWAAATARRTPEPITTGTGATVATGAAWPTTAGPRCPPPRTSSRPTSHHPSPPTTTHRPVPSTRASGSPSTSTTSSATPTPRPSTPYTSTTTTTSARRSAPDRGAATSGGTPRPFTSWVPLLSSSIQIFQCTSFSLISYLFVYSLAKIGSIKRTHYIAPWSIFMSGPDPGPF